MSKLRFDQMLFKVAFDEDPHPVFRMGTVRLD